MSPRKSLVAGAVLLVLGSAFATPVLAQPMKPAAQATAPGNAALPKAPTPQQERYMAARAFELQIQEMRAYCGTDPALKQKVESGWTSFRSRNPDFAATLANKPTEPDFVAASQQFEANAPKVAAMMRERVRVNPASELCPVVAGQLGSMKFADLVAQAQQQRRAGQSQPAPAQPQPPQPRPPAR